MRFVSSGALCALLTSAAVLASSFDYGTCGAPPSLDGSGECQDPGAFDWDHYQNSDVVVTPFQNPHVNRLDYDNLVGSKDASLFYSQATQPGFQAQFAAVLNFTMSYPTIITEDSAYISSCDCSDSSRNGTTSVTLTFTDSLAFSYARNWPSTGLVLVINAPGCRPQADERGVYLIDKIIANAPARTVRCQGRLKSWEDVSETLEIGFGRTKSETDNDSDNQHSPAATRTATRFWTSDGVLTSSTYITTALPIHFSTSITATSLRSTSYRRPSSRPGSLHHNGSSRTMSSSSFSPTSASALHDTTSSMTIGQSRSTSSVTYTTPSYGEVSNSSTGTTTMFRQSSETTSAPGTPTTLSMGTSSTTTDYSTTTSSSATDAASPSSTSEVTTTNPSASEATSTSSATTETTTTSLSTSQSTSTSSVSAEAMGPSSTSTVSSTSSSGSESTTTISTTPSLSVTSTTSESSSSYTTTTSTNESSTTSSGESESQSSTTSSTTSSVSVTVTTSESSQSYGTTSSTSDSLTTASSNLANATITSASSTTTGASTTALTTTPSTTRSYPITPPSLSPEAQEIWDAIMDVLEFDEDGAILLHVPDEMLADSNGEMPTTPFDPFDADQQASLLALSAEYGFDSAEQIVSDVKELIQEAASKEYAITPDMNIDETEPENYVAADMVDRSSVVGIDDPNILTAEDQKAYLMTATEDDRSSDPPRGDDDGGDGGEGDVTDPDAEGGEIRSDRRSANLRRKMRSLRRELERMAKRDDEDDDGVDPAEIAWGMAEMLGEMGCVPCQAAKKFKDAWDQAAAFIGIIDYLIKSSKIRFEAQTESWVSVAVPAQVLVDDWLRGNVLSCDDASFSVSSLIVETKLLVDMSAKQLLAGEITTSVTSNSNLQLKFESSGTMLGLWEFVAASMDLQSISSPGVFKISPRFLYNFGVHYEISAHRTITAGMNIAVTDAETSVDIGSKSVFAAKGWKPSKIDLKYPSVNPWEWAMIAPFTKTTIVLNLQLFGTRYDNAVVVTTQTKIGYEEGRVYLTESRQCQARNMKQVSTLDTLTEVNILGQKVVTLYKGSYPLNSRCWQPAGEPALCPEGVYDNDYYELGGFGWRVTCGEAVTMDTAYYDGNHLIGSSNGLDYERFPSLTECANECATTFYVMNAYGTGSIYEGCQMAVWLPDSGYNCMWDDWDGNKRIEGYGIAVARRTGLVDGCEYMKQSGILIDWPEECPDTDVDDAYWAAKNSED